MSTIEQSLPIGRTADEAELGSLHDGSGAIAISLSLSIGAYEQIDQDLLDAVLQLAFQRVQSSLRNSDTCESLTPHLLAVFLHKVEPGDVSLISQRLTDLLQRAYVVRGKTLFLNVHMGIVSATLRPNDYQGTLRHARIALGQAERRGPGTIVFFEDRMEARIKEQHVLAIDIRKALALRQFEVHYQPQVDLGDRKIVGFEALLRWKHPERGWVSPLEFIPLAEEVGLIGALGAWVLKVACRQACLLPGSVVMAVNASPLQLTSSSLLDSVERALAETKLPPQRLEIEITEGVLLEQSTSVSVALNALHSRGVRLAIDDFGTGYSSLGRLANLPFDTIKIDRSLVGIDPRRRAITQAVSTIGKGLGMSVLIEGIETEEQLANAIDDGCVNAQGFLFGKAVPANLLLEVIERVEAPYNESACQSTPLIPTEPVR